MYFQLKLQAYVFHCVAQGREYCVNSQNLQTDRETNLGRQKMLSVFRFRSMLALV